MQFNLFGGAAQYPFAPPAQSGDNEQAAAELSLTGSYQSPSLGMFIDPYAFNEFWYVSTISEHGAGRNTYLALGRSGYLLASKVASSFTSYMQWASNNADAVGNGNKSYCQLGEPCEQAGVLAGVEELYAAIQLGQQYSHNLQTARRMRIMSATIKVLR